MNQSFYSWLKNNLFAQKLLGVFLFCYAGFLLNFRFIQAPVKNSVEPYSNPPRPAAVVDVSEFQKFRIRKAEIDNLAASRLRLAQSVNEQHMSSIFKLFSNASFLQWFGESLSKTYLQGNTLPFATISLGKTSPNLHSPTYQSGSEELFTASEGSLEKTSSFDSERMIPETRGSLEKQSAPGLDQDVTSLEKNAVTLSKSIFEFDDFDLDPILDDLALSFSEKEIFETNSHAGQKRKFPTQETQEDLIQFSRNPKRVFKTKRVLDLHTIDENISEEKSPKAQVNSGLKRKHDDLIDASDDLSESDRNPKRVVRKKQIGEFHIAQLPIVLEQPGNLVVSAGQSVKRAAGQSSQNQSNASSHKEKPFSRVYTSIPRENSAENKDYLKSWFQKYVNFDPKGKHDITHFYRSYVNRAYQDEKTSVLSQTDFRKQILSLAQELGHEKTVNIVLNNFQGLQLKKVRSYF